VSSYIDRSMDRATGRSAEPVDLELFQFIETTLYTAVLSDALDELGVRECAMREHIRPLSPEGSAAGFARTISCVDVHYLPADPYALEIEAIDSILPGEVLVVATGGSKRNAPWGELLSTAAMVRGARGAIVDGLVRDVKKILSLGFPVFAGGIRPVDSNGRGIVIDYNVPVECGGVIVSPGDLVVADYDGVVVVPAGVAGDVVRLATEKVAREDGSRAELMNGAYLRDVFAKYGVL
jgi:4-hydroxy-4-methyl-2-oxoglutarate aldolase